MARASFVHSHLSVVNPGFSITAAWIQAKRLISRQSFCDLPLIPILNFKVLLHS